MDGEVGRLPEDEESWEGEKKNLGFQIHRAEKASFSLRNGHQPLVEGKVFFHIHGEPNLSSWLRIKLCPYLSAERWRAILETGVENVFTVQYPGVSHAIINHSFHFKTQVSLSSSHMCYHRELVAGTSLLRDPKGTPIILFQIQFFHKVEIESNPEVDENLKEENRWLYRACEFFP